MPYIDPAVRHQLGLFSSCPSDEDIAAACAAKGLQLQDGILITAGPADHSSLHGLTFAAAKAAKAKRTAAVQALKQL